METQIILNKITTLTATIETLNRVKNQEAVIDKIVKKVAKLIEKLDE